MSECPKEIEAEQSHPDEHGDTREVEWVTDGEAGLVGYRDEEFFGVWAGLIIVVVIVVGVVVVYVVVIVIVVGGVVVYVVVIVIVVVFGDLDVVANHEEHGCEEDKEDVGADDFALELFQNLITCVLSAIKQRKKM